MLIAVYGTLRHGHTAHKNHKLDSQAKKVAEVRIPGTMYNIGWFPGIILNDDPKGFVAEIYEVFDPIEPMLQSLDGYEGYDPARPEESLYIRKSISVPINDESMDVWIYEFNRPIDSREVVEGGDWNAKL